MKPTQVLGAKDQLNNMKQRPKEPVEDFVRDMQLKSAHLQVSDNDLKNILFM